MSDVLTSAQLQTYVEHGFLCWRGRDSFLTCPGLPQHHPSGTPLEEPDHFATFYCFFFFFNKPLLENRLRHSLSQTESVPNFLSKQRKIYKCIFPGTPSDLFRGKRHPAQRLMLSGRLISRGSHLFPQLIG